MKFGKRIQALVDAALPAWRDKFLAYKRLKKHLHSLINELLIAQNIRDAERRAEAHAGDGEIDAVLNAGGGSSSSAERKKGKRPHRCQKDHRIVEYGEYGGGRRRNKRRQMLLGEDLVLSRRLEAQFKSLLDRELEKLNDFFVEKEEEFIIKLQVSRFSFRRR
jgi:SPX domain protein involved in polyphosphate accumulation